MTDNSADFDAADGQAKDGQAKDAEALANQTGRDLRNDLSNWALLPWLERKERVAICDPNPPQADKLSEWVASRATFENTYSAEFKVKSDHDIPSKVLDAVQHNHMPQFTLRNIGRAERSVDLDDPLPFERIAGIGHHDDGLFEEVRAARLPEVEMAQVWSVAYSTRVRAQFRRLLLEDPWELKYGAEVKANHAGPLHKFVVEGTHPDDLPEADWGPQTLQPPDDWQGRDIAGNENVATFHDFQRKITGANG